MRAVPWHPNLKLRKMADNGRTRPWHKAYSWSGPCELANHIQAGVACPSSAFASERHQTIIHTVCQLHMRQFLVLLCALVP